MSDEEEVQHPDEQPLKDREPELDVDELVPLSSDGATNTVDEAVPEDSKGE